MHPLYDVGASPTSRGTAADYAAPECASLSSSRRRYTLELSSGANGDSAVEQPSTIGLRASAITAGIVCTPLVYKYVASRPRRQSSMMQQAQERPRVPPPAYVQHEPESLHLPSVPTHAPHRVDDNGRLPGIKSLDLPETNARHTPRTSVELSPRAQCDAAQWGMLPSMHSAAFPRVPDGMPRSGTEDIGSPMDTASVRSTQDDASRRETSVSMDDPDVRLAAEALSGLGNPGKQRCNPPHMSRLGLQY